MYYPLEESSGNILGFEIVGDISEKQKEQICKTLEKQVKEFVNIRLLLVVDTDGSIDAESLFFNLNFTLGYADSIERMAIVRGKAWEETWIGLFGLFSHIRTEYFDRSERKAAWKWVRG